MESSDRGRIYLSYRYVQHKVTQKLDNTAIVELYSLNSYGNMYLSQNCDKNHSALTFFSVVALAAIAATLSRCTFFFSSAIFRVYTSQMNFTLLQHESECQPSLIRGLRPGVSVMLQERQFSSAEGIGRSSQPKSGTRRPREPDQTHSFSVSMSLPEVQNSCL